jgi:hypothetical protein
MFRKMMLALTATAALGVGALTSTTASAWHFHGHGHFHGPRIGIVFGGPVYTSCWQYRYVETRRGVRRMLVNVCAY